jgi:phosphopantothenoylcysteine decarboxylase/phosphopantothenate--cysteine ligase
MDSSAQAPLLGERLLLGVTGSPSATTMPQYALMMRQTLAREVRVMMSRAAQRFVPAYTMRLYVGDWVYTDIDQINNDVQIPHIDLTRDIDLFLIMPATANIIGKAANGICDDLISTAIVASEAPVVLVPAMNGAMWRSSAVQQNVERARGHGYHIIEPNVGLQLADLNQAPGVMPPLEHILDQLIAVVAAARYAKQAQL